MNIKRVPNVVRTKEIMDDIVSIYQREPQVDQDVVPYANSSLAQDTSYPLSQFYLETRDEVNEQEGGRSDCTVGFMFICMLHLANEKNGTIGF